MIGFILILFYATPAQSNTQATTNSSYYEISTTYNNWIATPPIGNSSQSESINNTYWGLSTIHLNGTQRSSLNLTQENSEITLTNNSIFRFAWYFDSYQSDYTGFILYTANNSYYIVSYFGPTVFVNGSTQAIYEFTNEQPNTWYEHEVNLTALFLQWYGFLPQKITNIMIVNAKFGSTGLIASDQQSYFDDFLIYSSQSSIIKPNPPQHVTAQKETNKTFLMWDKPTITIGDVGHYNIYRSTTPNTNFSYLGSTTALNYTDNLQNTNQTYYYVVQSYNIYGNSTYSQDATFITQTTSISNSIPQQITTQDNLLSLTSSVVLPAVLAIGATGSVAAVAYTRRKKTFRSKVLGETKASSSQAWYVVLLLPIIGLIGLMRSAFYQLNTMQTLEHPLRRKIVQILEEYEYDHLNSLKVKTNTRIATLLWHLNELEKQNIIEKKKYHQYTIIYLTGRKPLDIELDIYVAMKSEKCVNILDYLLTNSSSNIKQVATEFNLKPSIIKGLLYRFTEMQTIGLQEETGTIVLYSKWGELFRKIVDRRIKELEK